MSFVFRCASLRWGCRYIERRGKIVGVHFCLACSGVVDSESERETALGTSVFVVLCSNALVYTRRAW